MTTDIFNLRIGSPIRELVIEEISVKTITMQSGEKSDKIVLHTKEPQTGKQFDISDSYLRAPDGKLVIRGMWVSLIGKQINPSSTLGKVLQYYQAEALNDLQGKRVRAYPDPEDYLVLTACDMPGELPQTIKQTTTVTA